MDTDLPSDHNRDLTILEQIQINPDATQASLATQLGVAVGTINWHIKRLVAKGYVKARRVSRRKLRYIITPEGLSLRAHLTLDYIETSFKLFRLVRQRMQEVLVEVHSAGYNAVRLEGNGDVADVCRLTCLEQGIQLVEDNNSPLLRICDLKVFVEYGDHHPTAERRDGHD